MTARALVPSLLSLLLVACAAPDVATSAGQARAVEQAPPAARSRAQEPAGGPAAADEAKAKQEQAKQEEKAAAEKRASLAKDLRNKKRQLDHTRHEFRIAALGREMREVTVAVAEEKAQEAFDNAKLEQEHFKEQQAPRELAEWQMRIDRAEQYAEQQKDELDELVAMYEADEFAKTTKELVLKRGRQSLAMAQRSLELTKKEFAEFRDFTLPKRAREFERRVDQAATDLRTARMEVQKKDLEVELQELKEAATVADLEEEIAELAKKLAEGDK